MRRVGERIVPGRSYRTRPGIYGVVLSGGRVLITEQAAPRAEFQLPGGGVDPGEGMLPALVRECLEETGWRVRPLRRLGAYQRYCYMPEYDLWARKVCHVYLCRPVRRIGPPAEPGHSALWAPLGRAARMVASDGDRLFLRGLAA